MAENRPENHKPPSKLAAASRSKKEIVLKKMSSEKAAAERRAVEAEARLAKAESALQAAQQSLYRMECRAKDEHGRIDIDALHTQPVDASSAVGAAVSAKVQALQNLHSRKVKALMQTINSLRLKAERAKQQSTTAGRGRRVQSQLRKIKQLELCVEYLKEQLASASNSTLRQVNEKLMKKTTGGMKRFRPKSREELQNELVDAERAVARAKRSEAKAQGLVKQLRQELEDAKAAGETADGRVTKNVPGSGSESGTASASTSTATAAVASAATAGDAGAVSKLLDELEQAKIQVSARDLTLRTQFEELEGLHDEVRSLKSERVRLLRADTKYREAKQERAALQKELVKLEGDLRRTEEQRNKFQNEVEFLHTGRRADSGAEGSAGFEYQQQLHDAKQHCLELEKLLRGEQMALSQLEGEAKGLKERLVDAEARAAAERQKREEAEHKAAAAALDVERARHEAERAEHAHAEAEAALAEQVKQAKAGGGGQSSRSRPGSRPASRPGSATATPTASPRRLAASSNRDQLQAVEAAEQRADAAERQAADATKKADRLQKMVHDLETEAAVHIESMAQAKGQDSARAQEARQQIEARVRAAIRERDVAIRQREKAESDANAVARQNKVLHDKYSLLEEDFRKQAKMITAYKMLEKREKKNKKKA